MHQIHTGFHKFEDITNDEIWTAALIATYYSIMSESSSVAVYYTKIKNLKKVPKIKGSFITMTHQKTIYIDPDKNIIDSLKMKKLLKKKWKLII